MLRQPAALAAKKRAVREDEWEKLQEEREKLAEELEEKEVKHSDTLSGRVYDNKLSY